MIRRHYRKTISILISLIMVSAFSPVTSALAYGEPASSDETPIVAMSVQEAEDATGIDADSEGTAYAEGEVIVAYKQGTTKKEAATSVQASDAVETDAITDDTLLATSVENGKLVADAGDNPMAVVDVSDGQTVAQAVAELEQDPNVAYAQPNYCYTIMDDETDDSGVTTQTTNINDPDATTAKQWFLFGASQSVAYGANCFDAWDSVKCDGNVTVAVIDTGCLVTHEDLQNNIVGAYNAYNAVHGGSTTDVTDIGTGHGTHVCGIISAQTNNSIGVSGVSYNAKIMPIKVFGTTTSSGGNTAELVKAYTYIINNASTYNIKVVNISLGNGVSSESSINPTDKATLGKMDEADSAGILTVCAACNSGSGYTAPFYAYPADYKTCISVINTNISGNRYSSSNYNTADMVTPASSTGDDVNGTKDICAPGTNILSTINSSSSSYGIKNGTSMSSPVVAGIAALVFAANSSLTPEQVKGVLYSSTVDLGATGWDRTFGWGLVDAAAAVKLAESSEEPLTSEQCTISGNVIYDGLAHAPAVTVKNAAGDTLTEGTDYTVTYLNSSGAVVASPTDQDTYNVMIKGVGNGTTGYYGTVNKTFRIIKVDRLSGGNRYTTMSSIVDKGFPDGSTTTAILATGENFPDALAANGLAGLYDAPVVLIDGSATTLTGTEAESELKRLGVTDVVVCGGSAAVSDGIYADLQTKYGESHVSRKSGGSRVDTALQILEAGKTVGSGWSSTVIVATSKNYADALSISPFSYAESSPIVLTDADGNLTAEDQTAITDGGFTHAIIVGGSAVVSADTQSWLEGQLGTSNVERLSGGSRYSTSVAIAKFSCGQDEYSTYPASFGYTALKYAYVGVATGQNFPDSLAGAALCGNNDGVLLLADDETKTSDAERSAAIDLISTNKNSINQVYIFGGTSAVTSSVEAAILTALGIG